MSAFVCDPAHIKALALFAVRRVGGPGNRRQNVDPRYLEHDGGADMSAKTDAEIASYYADVLYQENIRSVRARYPKDTWENLPGPCKKPVSLVITAAELARERNGLKPVDILKMCDCLEYQSCETKGYRDTLAFALLDRIRGAAVTNLPGYDEAPWEYTGPKRGGP